VRKASATAAQSDGSIDLRRTDTRARLLELAAHHFAEHSYKGASLRAIQRELGVNPATIHYHFGSKADLYEAVISPFLDAIQAERLARLAKTPADLKGRARLEALMRGYLAPHLEVASTPAGYNYARILAMVQVTVRDEATDLFDVAVGPVRTKYAQALAPLFPDVPMRKIYEVLAMAVGHMALAPIRLGKASLKRQRMNEAIDDAVAYTSTGFEALCGPARE